LRVRAYAAAVDVLSELSGGPQLVGGANLVVFELEEATVRSELERVFRGLAKRVIERQAVRTSPAAFSALFGRSKGVMKERAQCEGREKL
jgi:hypothetical protein